MNVQDLYEAKLTSGKEAISKIKSGDRVIVGHAAGEPSYLMDILVENKDLYEGVEIVHFVAMGKSTYAQPGYQDHFYHKSMFVSGPTRKAVAEGRADYTPGFFHEAPQLFRTSLRPNVALVTLSPMDSSGYFSLGISCDYTKSAVEEADLVIAQVNRHMPRTLGDAFVHVSDLDWLVEWDAPLIELMPPKIGPVESEIGRHVASLVRDGDTLQVGIGAVPDAVLTFLGDKKDLGIHSEMVSDGVMDLAKSGVITGAKKSLHRGKMVIAFIMGTQDLYDWVHDNPAIHMGPVDYVNDPVIIMKNENMVAINSCVEVDLMGQVASESVGLKQISGVGGQVDFVRGANMSPGGRAIIAMTSTDKAKTSKIVPFLKEGAAVTTSRNDVDYVVTEYGIAQLKGKTLRDRARALIEIAHPDFQDGLKGEYEARFFESY